MDNLVNIKVIGVGGAGNNAVNRMIEENVNGVEYIAVNTDKQVLDKSAADVTLILGQELTKGMGAGANPEIGRQAAEEQEAEIRALLGDADLVFIATGLGGGTGTGAAPVIAKVANELGILTIATVTKPFTMEGPTRKRNADEGLTRLKEFADTVITIPNDKLFEIIEKTTPIKQAFLEADKLLKHSITAITDLVLFPGLINLDFADITNHIKKSGTALIGIGVGTGDDAAIEAGQLAIGHPLLEVGLDGASKAIINFTGGESMPLFQVNEAVNLIKNSTAKDLDVIWGINVVEEMQDQIIVSIIATGYDENMDKLNSHSSGFGIDDEVVSPNFAKIRNDFPTHRTEDKNNKQPEILKPKVSDTAETIINTGGININIADDIVEDTVDNTFKEEDNFHIPNFFSKNK